MLILPRLFGGGASRCLALGAFALQSSRCSRHSQPRKIEKWQTNDTKKGEECNNMNGGWHFRLKETREQAMSDTIVGKSQQNKMGRPPRANTPSMNVNEDKG